MSKRIFREEVGIYEFSFYNDGNIWVSIVGISGRYNITAALCDPYDGISKMSEDVMIPFDAYVKYEWLKLFPHMKYAYEKCGDVVPAGKMAMITHVNQYPCLEPLLNNPHNKRYADFSFMWNITCDSRGKYEIYPAMLKQAIRNFHDASIEQCMFVPLSKAHEPQYRWLVELINKYGMEELTLIELANGWLTEKDMNYVIKLHAKSPSELGLDEVWIALEAYMSYRGMLREAVQEDLLPNNVLEDPYWVYPSPASYLTRRNRVADILNDFYDGQESHEEFDSHMERYKKYPIDITVDGFRFYTTTSREGWISHSDALKQCCYRLKYYAHEDSILTFVEKDGVPYGTIDYSFEYHHIQQARVDQSDYSKSSMPANVVKLFMKHVINMLENN